MTHLRTLVERFDNEDSTTEKERTVTGMKEYIEMCESKKGYPNTPGVFARIGYTPEELDDAKVCMEQVELRKTQ